MAVFLPRDMPERGWNLSIDVAKGKSVWLLTTFECPLVDRHDEWKSQGFSHKANMHPVSTYFPWVHGDSIAKVRGRDGELREDIPEAKRNFPECKSVISQSIRRTEQDPRLHPEVHGAFRMIRNCHFKGWEQAEVLGKIPTPTPPPKDAWGLTKWTAIA